MMSRSQRSSEAAGPSILIKTHSDVNLSAEGDLKRKDSMSSSSSSSDSPFGPVKKLVNDKYRLSTF